MRRNDLLDELNAQNITVFIEDGKVKVSALPENFTEDIQQQIWFRKDEILLKGRQKNFNEQFKQILDKGCLFEFVENGVTVEYPSYLLTNAENAWLIENHKEVMAILFQMWLMQNLFNHQPDLLEEFKLEVDERISIMRDSGDDNAYLNGILAVSRSWWLGCQNTATGQTNAQNEQK